MSVLVVINSEKDLDYLPSWGLVFARSLNVSLKIAIIRKAKQPTQPNVIKEEEKSKSVGWLKQIKNSLAGHDDLPCTFSNETDDTESKKASTSVTFLEREHNDRLRATLMFARKEQITHLVVSRTDDIKDDPYTNGLLSECTASLIILKAAASPKMGEPGIIALASPGPNTKQTIKFGSIVAKSMNLEKLNTLNIETIGGNDAASVARKQVENLAKAAKIDTEFLSIKSAPSGPLKEAILKSSKDIPFQLILLGSTEKGLFRRLFFGNRDAEVIAVSKNQSIAVFRRAFPITARTKKRLDLLLNRYVPQLDRDARINVFASLQSGSYWNFDFIALISLASAIASLGLIQNSAAIVIGAMLVAPLMTPMIGAGLGLAQGNVKLVSTAAKTVCFGFLVSLAIGAFFGQVTGIESPTPEILARGAPNILDLFVAFLSGTAAAYAMSRPNLSGALPGVAIAAALVPPITSAGISLTTGDLDISRGAATLFGLNLLAIILAAALTLYAVGARPDRTEKKSMIWVQRCIIGLIAGTVALSFPLVPGIFKSVTDSSLRKVMEEKVSEQGSELRFYRWKGNKLIIEISGEKKISKENLEPLVKSIKSRTGQETQIRIHQSEIFKY